MTFFLPPPGQLPGSLRASRELGAYEHRFQTFCGDRRLRSRALPSPSHGEDFHDLIVERYEKAATLVTSSLELSEWREAFPDRLPDAAFLNRIPAMEPI